MKKLIIILAVVATLFSCTEENLLKPFGPADNTAPGVLTNVISTAIPGGVKINYVLPLDPDLSYIKAEYTVNGEKKSVVSSQFNTTLTIEGLPEKKEYEVDLYCVDKLNNKSLPIHLTILPEEPPVNVMFASLKVNADFGGFKIDYQNPSKSELSIYFLREDTVTHKLIFHEARVFTQTQGTYQVVGLPNKMHKFGVFVRDRFGNTSATKEFEDKPWREEYVKKNNFKYIGKPQVVDNDDWYSWSGRPQVLWDDVVGIWNFASTGPEGKFPHYLCIDLGDTVPIGRILLQQRDVFGAACPKFFDVYGVAKLPAVNYASPLEGWTKLNDKPFEVIKPSGRGKNEQPSSEDTQAAEKGIMFTIDKPFPRPAIRYLRFVFLSSFYGMDGDKGGIYFSEFSLWAQWK